MKYREYRGRITEIQNRNAAVSIQEGVGCEERDGRAAACASCGKCGFGSPGSDKITVKLTDGSDFISGDAVRVRYPKPSFLISVLSVFVLPLVFLVSFPLSVRAVADAAGWDIGLHDWVFPVAAFSGLAVAILIAICINRAILKSYPPEIRKAVDHGNIDRKD